MFVVEDLDLVPSWTTKSLMVTKLELVTVLLVMVQPLLVANMLARIDLSSFYSNLNMVIGLLKILSKYQTV